MNSKKSILIFSNIFPNPDNENKGIFIKQLTDSLANHYNITVVSPVAVNPLTFLIDIFRKSNTNGIKQSAKQMISKIVKGNALVVGNLMHTGQHGIYFMDHGFSQSDYLNQKELALNA